MAEEITELRGQEPTAPIGGQEPHAPTLTLEQALEALAATRRENAAHRKRNADLEKAQQDADAAKLSDLEKATKKAAEAEAKLQAAQAATRERISRYEVQLAAGKLGIVDPDAAAKLLDWSAIEFTDDGSPKDLDKALGALVKQRPWLLGQQPQPQAGATNPARNHAQGQMTLADVKRLSKQQIASMTSEQRAQMYDALARG